MDTNLRYRVFLIFGHLTLSVGVRDQNLPNSEKKMIGTIDDDLFLGNAVLMNRLTTTDALKDRGHFETI